MHNYTFYLFCFSENGSTKLDIRMYSVLWVNKVLVLVLVMVAGYLLHGYFIETPYSLE